MIDPDLIESYSEDEQKMIRSAFITLSSCGILLKQVDRIASRVLNGADTQDKNDLVADIMSYRWKAAGLRTLHQVGESFLKEQQS